MSRRIWTESDIDFLKKNLASMSLCELANKFNVTKNSIAHKISNLGLSKKAAVGEYWSPEDDILLAKHFEYAPKNMLLRLFPSRTWPAITQRGYKTLKMQRKTKDQYYIQYDALSQWNESTAYIVGFVMADGYIKYHHGVRKENSLQFEQAAYDKDILLKMAKYLSFEGPIRLSKRSTAKLNISNVKIIEDLIDKGVPQRDKTFTANFPPKLPPKMIKHFIRGLYDGDGSIYNDCGTVAFQLLGTEKLLEQIKDKLPRFFENISLYDRSKNGANIFCLKVKGKKAKDLLDWMYKDSSIYLQRKYDKYCQIVNSPS